MTGDDPAWVTVQRVAINDHIAAILVNDEIVAEVPRDLGEMVEQAVIATAVELGRSVHQEQE